MKYLLIEVSYGVLPFQIVNQRGTVLATYRERSRAEKSLEVMNKSLLFNKPLLDQIENEDSESLN